jgi:MYXO-CTERM domain-containing protein
MVAEKLKKRLFLVLISLLLTLISTVCMAGGRPTQESQHQYSNTQSYQDSKPSSSPNSMLLLAGGCSTSPGEAGALVGLWLLAGGVFAWSRRKLHRKHA